MKTLISVFHLKKYFPLLFSMALLAACATPPDYPVEPEIEFISVSKDTMNRNFIDPSDPSPFKDTIFITFSFTDGDGDIGDQEGNLQLFIRDSRDGFLDDFGIPFIPELGASNGLKGEMTVRIFSSCCIFPPEIFLLGCEDEWNQMPYDMLTYDIYIKDRAGNQSNTITTTPIYIKCFE